MTKLNVLYTSDQKYLDTMLVSIYSLLENSNIGFIRLHLVTSGLSQDDYHKIDIIKELYDNVELNYYSLDKYFIEQYHIPSFKHSQLPNARLFFQDILHHELSSINQLLYLDSDTIVTSSLEEIINYDGCICACKDTLKKEYFCSLKLDTYYNSGVLLFNVNSWIDHDCQKRILDFIRKAPISLKYPDQDILNCVLKNEFKELPMSYNVPASMWSYGNLFRKLYFNPNIRNITSEDIQEARTNSKILHCYGIPEIRPWNTDFHPYYDKYMKYMRKINPNFSMEELDPDLKLKIQYPHLYEVYILLMNYNLFPHKAVTKIKKFIK